MIEGSKSCDVCISMNVALNRNSMNLVQID